MSINKFSEVMGIIINDEDDWYDPIVGYDTRLFIDPFLIFRSTDLLFRNSHKKIIRFFNSAVEIISSSRNEKSSFYYKRARSILLFPEINELCLGFSSKTSQGAGSGKGFSEAMIDAIWTTIIKETQSLNHFEQLEIFNEGIGPDRISDITANILKKELIQFTQQVCEKHSIKTKSVPLEHVDFNFDMKRWEDGHVNLPVASNQPIILVPKKFLRHVPELNSDDFGSFLKSHDAEYLRQKLNFEIGSKLNKRKIVLTARKCPDLVRKYLEHKEANCIGTPYDFSIDSDNFETGYSSATNYASSLHVKLANASNHEQFLEVINVIISEFKKWVEDNSGRELLVNDNGSPRKEAAAQRLFTFVAVPICKANNIDISKEANIGSGPVDFKFSSGYSARILVEVKKPSVHLNFLKNIEKQLPRYLSSEDVKNGIYLIIRTSKDDDIPIEEAEKLILKLNEKGLNISMKIINAEKRPSASKER
jgi:hypothetical protein